MMSGPDETGRTVLELAQAGRFAEINDLFAPKLRPMVPPQAIEAAWTDELGKHGPITGTGECVTEPAGQGVVLVRIPVRTEDGGFTLLATVAGDTVLVGLRIAAAAAAEPIQPWQPPEYADPASFDEQEVTVGSGELAVPGTLSLPHRYGRRPAVLLLAGSGPHDRDETIGRNKPFRDLAWGLAGRGVVVLRHDKVTYAHPEKLGREFTLADEYLPSAAAAIALLRADRAVDANRIFLIGHSLGGTIAPRVAAAEPAVAGLVLLAGGAQPMHRAAVRQVRYLATLESGASDPLIAALTRQAEAVDSPDLSTATPDTDLPFGTPAAYWLDVRGYDPVATAATVHRPFLILQGGRDYQVTVADDLALWQAGLGDRADVTIRVHDADNHLFCTGEGPPNPAEYEPAQHMDPAVVAGIADWVLAQ
jgi:hypothetical protein